MASTKRRKKQDRSTRAIFRALRQGFPGIAEEISEVVYRYNSAAIRVRIIEPKFRGLSSAEREQLVDAALAEVDRLARDDITMQLMLTPEEADDSTNLLSLEFDDLSGSRL